MKKNNLLVERFQKLAGIKSLNEAPANYDNVKSKVLDIINNMSPDEKQNLDNQSIYNIISKVEASTKEYLFGDESDDLEAEIVGILSGKSQGDDEEVKVVGTDNVDSRNTILRLSNGSFVEVDVIGLYQNLKDNQELAEDYSKGNDLKESLGFVELMDVEGPIEELVNAFDIWKEGPMTEPEDIIPAKKDLMDYVSRQLDLALNVNKELS